MFHALPAATADMAVLLCEPEAGRPRVLYPATYRSGNPRVQSRGTAEWLPVGAPIFTVSRQQFMKHPG